MERKVNTDGTVMAFATYRAKPGKDDELRKLVDAHLPALKELGFITDRSSYFARAKDGTLIEVFEWVSTSAISAAHQHPAISRIWEKMILIAEFPPMSSLQEAGKAFPGFEIIS